MRRAILAAAVAMALFGCDANPPQESDDGLQQPTVQHVQDETPPPVAQAAPAEPSPPPDPDDPPARVRGPLPPDPKDNSVADDIEDMIKHPPVFRLPPPPRRPSIDFLFNDLPDPAVPPWLKPDDTFGWAKLNNALNRGLPKTIEFSVDVRDVTVTAAGQGDFIPTLRLEPQYGRDTLMTSYLGRPCPVRLSCPLPKDEDEFGFSGLDDNSHLWRKVGRLDEAAAEQFLKLKDKRLKLSLRVTGVEVTPHAWGENYKDDDQRFAPDVVLTMSEVRVLWPIDIVGELQRNDRINRVRCGICNKVSRMPPKPPEKPRSEPPPPFEFLYNPPPPPFACPHCGAIDSFTALKILNVAEPTPR